MYVAPSFELGLFAVEDVMTESTSEEETYYQCPNETPFG